MNTNCFSARVFADSEGSVLLMCINVISTDRKENGMCLEYVEIENERCPRGTKEKHDSHLRCMMFPRNDKEHETQCV